MGGRGTRGTLQFEGNPNYANCMQMGKRGMLQREGNPNYALIMNVSNYDLKYFSPIKEMSHFKWFSSIVQGIPEDPR